MLKIYIYWHKCWCNGCGTGRDGQVKIELLSFWSVNCWVSQCGPLLRPKLPCIGNRLECLFYKGIFVKLLDVCLAKSIQRGLLFRFLVPEYTTVGFGLCFWRTRYFFPFSGSSIVCLNGDFFSKALDPSLGIRVRSSLVSQHRCSSRWTTVHR